MKKVYKLKIEPITALHIGTGNELTPLDYLVSQKVGEMDFKRAMYMRYSWNKILDSLKGDTKKLNEFMRISNTNNMSELRDFFHKNVSIKTLEALCETTHEFQSLYYENMKKNPVQNASSVWEIIRNSDKDAVIPGSSIKGAIRTAIIDNEYQKQKNNNLNTKIADALEAQLLSIEGTRIDAKKDPFRCLSISDITIPFKKGSQFVSCVKNVHVSKNTEVLEEKASMQILSEFITGKLTGVATEGEGRILLDEQLYKSNPSIKKFYSMKDIVKYCNDFYMKRFEEELDTFYKYESSNTELITPLQDMLTEAISQPNTFILRVGRWSQVEFVTISDKEVRNPKTPNKKGGGKMPYGTSRFDLQYNGQFLPIGWCKCTVIEEQD